MSLHRRVSSNLSRVLILAVFFVLSGMPGLGVLAYGDEATLISVEFEPESFLPGALVTLYARLEPGDKVWSGSTRVAGFPDTGAMGPQLLSAVLEKRGGSPLLIIKFVPWKAGPSYLPELSIEGILIPRIRFDCDTALTPGDMTSPQVMGQLDFPGVYSRLYILGGSLIVAALLGLTLAKKAGPWLLELRLRVALARSRKAFDETLRRLGERGAGEGADEGADAAAWAELCSAVRQFTGLRSGSDWSALTTSEVLALPDDAAPGGVQPDVVRLFAMGDAVRFAGDSMPRFKEALGMAASIADRLDESTRRTGRPAVKDIREHERSAS